MSELAGWPDTDPERTGQFSFGEYFGSVPSAPWVFDITAALAYDEMYPIDPLTPIWEETMKAVHVNPDEPLEWWADLSLIEIDVNGDKARARAIQKIQDHLTNTVLSIMGLSELPELF